MFGLSVWCFWTLHSSVSVSWEILVLMLALNSSCLFGFVFYTHPFSWPWRKKAVTGLVRWRGHKPVEINWLSKLSFKKSIVLWEIWHVEPPWWSQEWLNPLWTLRWIGVWFFFLCLTVNCDFVEDGTKHLWDIAYHIPTFRGCKDFSCNVCVALHWASFCTSDYLYIHHFEPILLH